MAVYLADQFVERFVVDTHLRDDALREGTEELFLSIDIVKLGVFGLRREEKPELLVLCPGKEFNVSAFVLLAKYLESVDLVTAELAETLRRLHATSRHEVVQDQRALYSQRWVSLAKSVYESAVKFLS